MVDFVGESVDTPDQKCPAVWRDEGRFYFRGKVVRDPVLRARFAQDNEQGADEETVWLPASMADIIAEAAAGTYEKGRVGHGPVTGLDLINSARHSAFHLEMRDVYDTSHPAFQDWLAGGSGRYDRSAWEQVVTKAVERGVRMRRVRVVSEPVTDYIAWEHMLTDQNIEFGEDVRWLPRRQAFDLMLPGSDLWLIDNQVVVFNFCTGDGVDTDEEEFTSAPDTVARCLMACESAWDRAIPHADYEIKQEHQQRNG